MKWFVLTASITLSLVVSPVQADVFTRFQSFLNGDHATQGPIQTDGGAHYGPIQADGKGGHGHGYGTMQSDGKAYGGSVQAHGAYQAPAGDCGCSSRGFGSGFKGFGGGCCERAPSCCDNVWKGYCGQRKQWCHQKPSCGTVGKGHCQAPCGKGHYQAPCHACQAPSFHLPKVRLPKVHMHIDWPCNKGRSGCCAPSWRSQSVPACHNHLGWLKRKGCCDRGCDSCSGKSFYDGGKGHYDGGKGHYDGGSSHYQDGGKWDGKVPVAPEVQDYDVPAPALQGEASAEANDNAAWILRPFLAR